jgi:cytochrome b subunit of formate dehydrogenase
MSTGEKVVAYIIMTVLALALIAGIALGLRWFNKEMVQVVVHDVEPGIHCALATTTEGVAIACWEHES